MVFVCNEWNVVINGVHEGRLKIAEERLRERKGEGEVLGVAGNVAVSDDIQKLMDKAVVKFGAVDFWINNAEVNQPSKAMSGMIFMIIRLLTQRAMVIFQPVIRIDTKMDHMRLFSYFATQRRSLMSSMKI